MRGWRATPLAAVFGNDPAADLGNDEPAADLRGRRGWAVDSEDVDGCKGMLLLLLLVEVMDEDRREEDGFLRRAGCFLSGDDGRCLDAEVGVKSGRGEEEEVVDVYEIEPEERVLFSPALTVPNLVGVRGDDGCCCCCWC